MYIYPISDRIHEMLEAYFVMATLANTDFAKYKVQSLTGNPHDTIIFYSGSIRVYKENLVLCCMTKKDPEVECRFIKKFSTVNRTRGTLLEIVLERTKWNDDEILKCVNEITSQIF